MCSHFPHHHERNGHFKDGTDDHHGFIPTNSCCCFHQSIFHHREYIVSSSTVVDSLLLSVTCVLEFHGTTLSPLPLASLISPGIGIKLEELSQQSTLFCIRIMIQNINRLDCGQNLIVNSPFLATR